MTKTSDTKGLTKKQKKILLQAIVDHVWAKLFREHLIYGHHQDVFNSSPERKGIPIKRP